MGICTYQGLVIIGKSRLELSFLVQSNRLLWSFRKMWKIHSPVSSEWGEMRFATKDHIEHIEHDGEMDWEERRLTGTVRPTMWGDSLQAWEKNGRGRLTGDGSPYLGIGLLWVGMSVPAHPPWV